MTNSIRTPHEQGTFDLTRSRLTLLIRLLVAVLFSAVSTTAFAQDSRLAGTTSWAYQLQNFTVESLKASSFDVVVIDYSFDGSKRQALTLSQVQEIRASGKKVLAYFSIGEAEDYRYYFSRGWVRRSAKSPCRVALTSRAPRWLDKPNSNWCGNYKTRYWDRNWQRVLFGVTGGARMSYLDQILNAGFDGVYLDIVDGYEYWLEKTGSQRRRTAADDMAKLVISIANYARDTRGNSEFIIVPQNGAGILSKLSAERRTAYLNAIDGIGAEDSYFYGNRNENNPLRPQRATIEALRTFRDAGKVVLAIDYLTNASRVLQFKTLACNEGFLPQVGRRYLDSLGSNRLLGCQ